jgi:hypothetical protein
LHVGVVPWNKILYIGVVAIVLHYATHIIPSRIISTGWGRRKVGWRRKRGKRGKEKVRREGGRDTNSLVLEEFFFPSFVPQKS